MSENKSSTLADFLIEGCEGSENKEVVISKRLSKHPFTIKPMSGKEYYEYVKASTKILSKKAEFDAERFNIMVIVNHTINPNFKSADDIKKAGCTLPEQYLNKVLFAGEIVELAKQISEISGFNESMDDLVIEAKNS